MREPRQPFASLTDVFYGAFKLKIGPIDNAFDTEALCLTNSYLFQLQPDGRLDWFIGTETLIPPTRSEPNP